MLKSCWSMLPAEGGSILAFGECSDSTEQCQQLDALLTRRRDGEPIAHLTGVRQIPGRCRYLFRQRP